MARLPLRMRAASASLSVMMVACADHQNRVVPEVERSDGVETATLPALPATLDPGYMWSYRELREIPTVGEVGGDPLVFEPSEVLPLRDGRLLVHDPTAAQPLVLIDPGTGTALARFGRGGQGPGELGLALTFVERGDTLLALDGGNQQLHRYSMEGVRISSESFRTEGRLGKALLDPSGESFLLEGFRYSDAEWHGVLERIDIASGALSPLLRLPNPSPGASPGFIQQGRIIWTVVGGGVVAMWSARPSFAVYSSTGEVARQVRLPLSVRHLTQADIDHDISLYGGMAANQRPGPTSLTNELYPVSDTIFAMLLTSGRRAAEDPALPEGEIWWRLFTARGEYLGVARPPGDYASFKLLYSGGGRIWARVLDEVGNPVLQELELVRSDGVRIPVS